MATFFVSDRMMVDVEQGRVRLVSSGQIVPVPASSIPALIQALQAASAAAGVSAHLATHGALGERQAGMYDHVTNAPR